MTIEGHVRETLHLALSDLKTLPATEVEVSFGTGHGQESAPYRGAPLWDLIQEAGLPDEPGKGKHHLSHGIEVTGADGYTVAVAMGELDPEFEGKQVLIAYEKDGQPIQGTGLRLVVPGDHRGGRSVRDVMRIEVE